ncbi:MAG: GNAT family N-acetyltransferase [Maribacter sp.]|uniref:GNAT family N-acetyltransferase n=1 Tax=Maribacter sp. TaxID=1897614 RepID=UPI003C7547AA
MVEIVRTNSKNSDFKALVRLLDADLAERDGEDHAFYDQFNKIQNIAYTIVLFENGKAQGCGAIKEIDSKVMEVKRMFTLPESRGKGFASRILTELETWAAEMGYTTCMLETGKRQPEAISLYVKNGYRSIANYGQYKGVENSVCFKKSLRQ